MLNDKVVLVTGATGSFGKKFIARTLEKYPSVRKVIAFSRDELKQFEMSRIAPYNSPKMRFFLGDIRDEDRLVRAFENVDVVIHAAALKQVPAAEYNPMEFIKTNVLGAENVVNAAIKAGVKKVVALSTDKAVAPVNLYGATKLCSDKLFAAANHYRGSRDLTFSVVRYGNVFGSRGSVAPLFLEQRKSGTLSITDAEMTRFSITLKQAIDLVYYAVENAWGGEIFIPKIPSYRIQDMAKAIAPGCDQIVTGIRPGEKLHEEMITEMDSINAVEVDNSYILLPAQPTWDLEKFKARFKPKAVPRNFRYRSNENTDWLSVDQLRKLIVEELDPQFSPT